MLEDVLRKTYSGKVANETKQNKAKQELVTNIIG